MSNLVQVKVSAEPITAFLTALHPPGSVFEVRAFGCSGKSPAYNGWTGNAVSGYFNDIQKAVDAIMKLEECSHPEAIYTTLNSVNSSLLARADNRLIGRPKTTTADKDVSILGHLLLDFDPIRASGISSTEDELKKALELRSRVINYLESEYGVRPLLTGMSGNGGHAIYRLPEQLPNTPDNVELLKQVLTSLSIQFANDSVEIDRSVFNPSRITKIFGTTARKGENVTDRPHRLSQFDCEQFSDTSFSLDKLKNIAGQTPKDPKAPTLKSTNTDSGTLNVEAYCANYGIETIGKKQHGDATLYLLKECVFDPSHTKKEAGIGQQPSGALFYKCFHNSCRDRTWRGARTAISGEDSLEQFIDGGRPQDGKKNQVTLLTASILQLEGTELFHNGNDGFVTFYRDGIFETWPLQSEELRNWISFSFYKSHGKVPSANTINDAVSTLQGKALFEGPEKKVHVRCAEYEGDYYLDLCNDAWQVIRVTSEGWEVINKSPVKFRRTSSMRPLPLPDKNHAIADICDELIEYLNIRRDDIELIVVWLIDALRPDTAYPVLELTGEQGSAKSTTQSNLHDCIDPNEVNLRTAPLKTEDIYVGAVNNHINSYNNISYLSAALQDAFCSLSTGGGYASRTLYTNLDETTGDIKRPVIFNGISSVITAPDLLDRTIQLSLPPIPPDRRQTEAVLKKEFATVLPKLLGVILDAFSKTLKELPNIQLAELPRMADFAILGEAAAKALGWRISFIDTFYKNRERALLHSIDSSPVISRLIEYFGRKGSLRANGEAKNIESIKYYGNYASLLHLLEPFYNNKGWPTSGKGLRNIIMRYEPALRIAGIRVAHDPIRKSDGYRVMIWREEE